MLNFLSECIECKSIFKTNNNKKTLCCNKCENEWIDSHKRDFDSLFDKIPNRQCLNCKVIFTPKTIRRNCCSIKCKHKYWQDNNRNKFNNYRKIWRKKDG